MFHLPIGQEFLEITTDIKGLEEVLFKWYQNPKNESGQFLGKVNIVQSNIDYSNNPTIPHVEWLDHECLFLSNGCRGVVGRTENALLEISHPYSLHYIEQFLRVVTAIQVFRRGGLLVHSAGLIKEGKGYLFSGTSGAGKTTVCRITKDCLVLNDDLVILYPEGKNWLMGDTPFSNPTQVRPGRGTGKLDMIIQLRQAKQHAIRMVPFHVALATFITHIPVMTLTSQFSSILFERAKDVINKSTVRDLEFLPDDGFWRLLEPES